MASLQLSHGLFLKRVCIAGDFHEWSEDTTLLPIIYEEPLQLSLRAYVLLTEGSSVHRRLSKQYGYSPHSIVRGLSPIIS